MVKKLLKKIKNYLNYVKIEYRPQIWRILGFRKCWQIRTQFGILKADILEVNVGILCQNTFDPTDIASRHL